MKRGKTRMKKAPAAFRIASALVLALVLCSVAAHATFAQEVVTALRNAPRGGATITFKQEKSGATGAGTSLALAFPSANTSGSTLIAYVSTANPTGTAYTTGASDPTNGAWTNIGTFFNSFSNQVDAWCVTNTANTALTVTFTSSTSTRIDAAEIEYTGLAGCSGIDTALAQTTGQSSPINTPNATTTHASDLILAGFVSPGNLGTVTVAAPYTLRHSTTSTGAGFGEQIVSSANTYTGASFTPQFGGSGAGVGVIMALKSQ